MNTTITAPLGNRPTPFAPALPALSELEDEARRRRAEFAHDPTVRLIVGLDLLIRQAAYRLIALFQQESGRSRPGPHAGLTLNRTPRYR